MAPRQTAAEKAAAAAAKEQEDQGNTEGTETPENTEPGNTEAPATGATVANAEGNTGTEEKAKRAMPVYGLSEGLDDLPAQAPRASRDQMFVNLLTPIVEDENRWGKWFGVATYKTPTGAREAEKAIEKGEREIPAGQWETATRRIEPELADGETTTHKRWSRLFFRFMGPADEADGGSETPTE